MKINSKIDKFKQCLKASIVPPQLNATAFTYQDAAVAESGAKLIYGRQDYPGSLAVEQELTNLETAADSAVFSSGMAAITSVMMALSPGDAVVVPRQIYWPMQVWLCEFSANYGIFVNWVDSTDADCVLDSICPKTRMIWLEMLTNPDLRLLDVRGIAERRPADILLAVNATCLSPILARPINLGADLVIHSASKILGGHNDLLGGVVSTAKQDPFWDRITRLRWLLGNGMSARDASLLHRSLSTLEARVLTASSNAMHIAEQLRSHPLVEEIIYPGLQIHPDYHMASTNLTGEGFGPLLGLHMRLSAEQCQLACANTQIWNNATSFGGVHSSLEHRATAEYTINQSSANYLRLSVGLEPVADLMADLESSLEQFQMQLAV